MNIQTHSKGRAEEHVRTCATVTLPLSDEEESAVKGSNKGRLYK